MPRNGSTALQVTGLVGLLIVAVAVVAAVVGEWPPWPHREPADLAALVALAPDVPGGRLYWEDRQQTECSWTDCPDARLQRRYLVPCAAVDEYAARLGQQFERRGFPTARRLFAEESYEDWEAGSVAADVSDGRIWADYSTRRGADVASQFSEVSYSAIEAGCTLLWTLSVSDPRPHD
jgi:hypothetical protein